MPCSSDCCNETPTLVVKASLTDFSLAWRLEGSHQGSAWPDLREGSFWLVEGAVFLLGSHVRDRGRGQGREGEREEENASRCLY